MMMKFVERHPTEDAYYARWKSPDGKDFQDVRITSDEYWVWHDNNTLIPNKPKSIPDGWVWGNQVLTTPICNDGRTYWELQPGDVVDVGGFRGLRQNEKVDRSWYANPQNRIKGKLWLILPSISDDTKEVARVKVPREHIEIHEDRAVSFKHNNGQFEVRNKERGTITQYTLTKGKLVKSSEVPL